MDYPTFCVYCLVMGVKVNLHTHDCVFNLHFIIQWVNIYATVRIFNVGISLTIDTKNQISGNLLSGCENQ